jgi:hypothetical protein
MSDWRDHHEEEEDDFDDGPPEDCQITPREILIVLGLALLLCTAAYFGYYYHPAP